MYTAKVKVNGKESSNGMVGRTVPADFTASECFNVGVDLGSPVSERYYDKEPFRFSGKINSEKVDLI